MKRKPDQSFTLGGTRSAYRYRLRKTWFGRLVLEELVEYRDGNFHWQKMDRPLEVADAGSLREIGDVL